MWKFNGTTAQYLKFLRIFWKFKEFQIFFRDFQYCEVVSIKFPHFLRDFQISNICCAISIKVSICSNSFGECTWAARNWLLHRWLFQKKYRAQHHESSAVLARALISYIIEWLALNSRATLRSKKTLIFPRENILFHMRFIKYNIEALKKSTMRNIAYMPCACEVHKFLASRPALAYIRSAGSWRLVAALSPLDFSLHVCEISEIPNVLKKVTAFSVSWCISNKFK